MFESTGSTYGSMVSLLPSSITHCILTLFRREKDWTQGRNSSQSNVFSHQPPRRDDEWPFEPGQRQTEAGGRLTKTFYLFLEHKGMTVEGERREAMGSGGGPFLGSVLFSWESTTSTCQPQCRNAVLNVYQNKLGRALLRSDGTCIPGREELRSCNFMPTGNQVHCSVAKLVCEGDLQCQAKWTVFMSECEAESARGECSTKCRGLLAASTTTPGGNSFNNCSCTEREDNLCLNLKDNVLGPCTKAPAAPMPDGNSITDEPAADSAILPSLITVFFTIVGLL